MKQFLQDKYPALLHEGKLFVDSVAMEKIIKCPRSIAHYLAFEREEGCQKWVNFASGIYAAFAIRHNDFWSIITSEESLERQITAITDHFSNNRQDGESFYVAECAINALLEYDAHYKLKQFTIHAMDGRPCLEMSFAIPIGHIEDIPILWTGRIPSIVILNEKLYIMVHKIKSPTDDDDFELYRNTSELIGYYWAYEQIAHAGVEGILIDLIRVHDMGLEPEHIEFNREFAHYHRSQIDEWQSNVIRVINNFLNSAKSL